MGEPAAAERATPPSSADTPRPCPGHDGRIGAAAISLDTLWGAPSAAAVRRRRRGPAGSGQPVRSSAASPSATIRVNRPSRRPWARQAAKVGPSGSAPLRDTHDAP